MLSPIIFSLLIDLVYAQPITTVATATSFTTVPCTTESVSQNPSNGGFSYWLNPEPTYAKSNEGLNVTKTYARPYSEVSTLLGSLSTTTWGSWNPNATDVATDSDDPYGQYAWTQMWLSASVDNFTYTGIYSTTVEPTAIPTESLVLPPPDPFSFDESLKFPEDFVFGVAGSAAQIEGAVAEEGKTPTVLEKIVNITQPKDYVTNENYYLYKQDIARLAAIGVKYYSFTIPWSRILPFVLPGTPVNQQGIDHYDDLINTCLEYGIEPIVTLMHFDSPLMFTGGKPPSSTMADYPINNNGGYDNDTFVDAFVNYGKIVLTHYADRVSKWVGINEPFLYVGTPLGIKNVVLVTAKLHKFYHEELGGTGEFGIKLNDNFGIPKDPSNQADIEAANNFNDLQLASFGNPLFLGKDFPAALKNTFSNTTDFYFTDDELAEVKGGCDFLGIDPYTYTVVSAPPEGISACQELETDSLRPYCVVQEETRADGWKVGYRSQSYVYITPIQLREYLNYLWQTFKAPIIVSEFGFPEWREGEKALGDQLYDIDRSIYYRSFLEAILQAIHYDNVNVTGALAWSFADNWEFGDYSQQFGLQVVNRTTQERYYKKSFFDTVKYYQDRS